jgi:hypothetical protein
MKRNHPAPNGDLGLERLDLISPLKFAPIAAIWGGFLPGYGSVSLSAD